MSDPISLRQKSLNNDPMALIDSALLSQIQFPPRHII